MVVSKKFLHFSKHHFPKDSESGLKSRKISSLSFLTDLKHPSLEWYSYPCNLQQIKGNSQERMIFENLSPSVGVPANQHQPCGWLSGYSYGCWYIFKWISFLRKFSIIISDFVILNFFAIRKSINTTLDTSVISIFFSISQGCWLTLSDEKIKS